MNTLSITHLHKTYANGIVAINRVSLELQNGLFGLLGPNGAGKSSLMRTIAGLQSPDSGIVLFNGKDTTNDPILLKKHLGYLPQDFGVYPRLSALALLEHIAVLKGVTGKAERKMQIEQVLVQTNLYAQRKQAVSTFSGGMRQRFGVAQALLGEPGLIIVDEPTAGLDPEERHRFNTLLSKLGDSAIVILSTHLVEDVRNLCTSMAILSQGTVIAKGNPETLINELRDRLWTKRIDHNALEEEKLRHRVISSHFIAGSLHIVVESDQHPGMGFQPQPVGLEEVYFCSLTPQSRHAQ